MQNDNADPEMEQIKGDRFYEVAQLLDVQIQPTQQPAAMISPRTVQPGANAQAISGVDNPATWIQPKSTEAGLRSLADVQAPNFTPLPKQLPKAPVPDDLEQEEAAIERRQMPRRPSRWQQQIKRDLWQFLQREETGTIALIFVAGVTSRLIAHHFLPAQGLQIFEYGSVGLLLLAAIFAFMEREFYLALAFVVGVIIAKRFL